MDFSPTASLPAVREDKNTPLTSHSDHDQIAFTHVNTLPEPRSHDGWRILRSDAGRLWATRERPFPRAAEMAGAFRTVDADNFGQLHAEIAQQERIADAALSGSERTARSDA